jgi:hypothetical protein
MQLWCPATDLCVQECAGQLAVLVHRLLTIEWRAFERTIWLLHDHDVDCSSHMWGEPVDRTQDCSTPHDHPTLQRGTRAWGEPVATALGPS